MSHKGSREMHKQYGRQEVAFNLKEPDRRGRPDPSYTCARPSEGQLSLGKEFGTKARTPGAGRDCHHPTPLTTFVPGDEAGYSLRGNGRVPNPPIYMGRQNANQGNAEFKMGAASFVPGTVLSNSLTAPPDKLGSTGGNDLHRGNTNLTGNSQQQFIPRYNPLTHTHTQY